MDILQKIISRKSVENAVIAAHTYQSPGVQAVADIIGDSFALAKKSASSPADTVYMCGVRFMAEGVKILSPNKRVVLVEPTADCPMARQIDPERVANFKRENPSYAVVAYINTTAALKAVSDVCVTSSSAVKIVSSIPEEDILFIPDKNLGKYVQDLIPNKNIITWEGYCPVHQGITAASVNAAKKAHPDALVAIHPECPPEAVALADMSGSTAAIIEYIEKMCGSNHQVIVATERGVVDKYSTIYPGLLHQLEADILTCPDMKRTTPEILLAALEGRGGEEIIMSDEEMSAARRSLVRMIELGG